MSHEKHNPDSWKALMQMQEFPEVPDALESGIMGKIDARRPKPRVFIGLQSVFVLSSLLALYILLTVLSASYYPKMELLKELRLLLPPIILVKLCYDLNEVLPGLLEHLPFFRKTEHR